MKNGDIQYAHLSSTEKESYGSIDPEKPKLDEHRPPPIGTGAEKCGFISRILSTLMFRWMNPIFSLGNNVPQLSPDDLKKVSLPTKNETAEIERSFDEYWQRELQQSPDNPSLSRALAYAFGADFIHAGFYKFVHDLLIFVGPQVLNSLIAFLRDADAPMSHGLWLTLVVSCSQLIMSLCLRQYFFQCFQTGLQLRSAIVTAVYKKVLVLSSAEQQIRSSGEVTNLMSIDASRLQDLTSYLHAVWYSFVQIGLAIFFLWKFLGPSCLGGVAVIFVMIPLSKMVAGVQGRIQKKLMKKRDRRVDVNNEVLGCMKIIKIQGWEKSFQDRIQELREVELSDLHEYILINTATMTLWSTVPLLVALATFTTYVFVGNVLDVASALTALALFDILRFPLFMLPKIINNLIDAQVSIERVREFLLADEHSPVTSGELNETGLTIDSATFVYDSKRPKDMPDSEWETMLLRSQLADAESLLQNIIPYEASSSSSDPKEMKKYQPTFMEANMLSLRRVNFTAKKGEMIAVVGAVGSGKTTFIQSLIGEVRALQGKVSVKADNIALCAQIPFIMNDTIRNNILFGRREDPFNQERYKTALAASALIHDLKLLPGGDMCEIGEKGVTLSGGQKARVAMARALYQDADVYLLDDVLSAVDAHVGKHLFQKCIVDELLLKKSCNAKEKSNVVILVTNALQYLSSPHVDKIVVLNNGCIEEIGTYSELAGISESLFASYLRTFMDSSSENKINALDESESSSDTDVRVDMLREVSSSALDVFLGNDLNFEEKNRNTIGHKTESTKGSQEYANGATLMTDELKEREIGAVQFSVYTSWINAAGGTVVGILLIIMYASVEGVNVFSKWWLAYWSEHGSDGDDSQMRFLAIYALINFTGAITMFFRIFFVMMSGWRASRKIFDDLIDNVLRAPMSFFDTTPLGRIINRFSKDIYTVDEQLPSTIRSYLATMTSVISTIVVISSVTPVFTACLVPILFFYLMQQRYFAKTYREIKRLDSVARSPIYALFSETLEGVSTVRAFSAAGHLRRRMSTLLDEQQLAYFLTFSSQCWLAVRLEFAGTYIIAFACLAAVFEHGSQGGNEAFAGFAGLSISFALSVTQTLNWSVRMASDLEAYMVAVERINQYTRIENEAPQTTDYDERVTMKWPSEGKIDFISVMMRYRPKLPLVLKGLDLSVPAQSKVGVVGRTGAGKSTIAMALLRIVEIDSGSIVIDGVDIRELGLSRLRNSIAVIPQDPILFSGSIRTNLDPFNSYEDDPLIRVLEKVGLCRFGESGESFGAIGALSDVVLEDGSNFSVGQKQLLVIARALLHEATIVIMDEATAAVDAETDQRLQIIMRTEFKNATCITIAHRLNTIMDSDYILCMDDGRAAEFDTPSKLMSAGGLFKDLVDAWEEENASSMSM